MATKIRAKNDPPVKVSVSDKIIAPKVPANDHADIRDILSMLVGSGRVSGGGDDFSGNYLRLKGLLGEKPAQKLVNSALLYNQRPEVQQLTPEQRVSGFYELGSSDPEISEHLNRSKSIGYGVLNGFRTSPLVGNMRLSGRDTGGGAGDAKAVEKLKLLVKNKTK